MKGKVSSVSDVFGSGGFGNVMNLGDGTVLKLPHGNKLAEECIIREAAALKLLADVDCVIDLVAFCETDDGRPCLRLPLIEHPTLDEVTIPYPHSLAIWLGVARAAEAGWKRGIIHRDIKPSNIFTIPTGPILFDYGLCYIKGQRDLSEADEFVYGTPHTIPVEFEINGYQVPTEDYDIYQLGVLLHYLVEDDWPTPGHNLRATLLAGARGIRASIRNEMLEARDLLMDNRDFASAWEIIYSKVVSFATGLGLRV